MNEQRDRNLIRQSIDAFLSNAQPDPWLAQRIIYQERKEPIVKKKLSFSIVLVIVLILITTAAVAVTNHFGILDYAPHQAGNAAYTKKIMTLDQRWEGEYFSASIHEAVFDGIKMTFTMSITPREGADPVYVIPHIRAFASGKELNTFVQGGNGGFNNDGFWVPDIMPDFGYDYEGWAVDVALTDDYRTYAPSAESVEWEITFDVLHTEWPIVFTQVDEPGIDEPEWTDADYAVYEQQFKTAYQNGQVLLNRAGMFGFYLYALDENVDEWHQTDMSWPEIMEMVLTKEVFTLKEQPAFRFVADSAHVKTSKEPVAFSLPDGYEAELSTLAVSADQIGLSLRITRANGKPASYQDFKWDFALLADGAQTAFEVSSCGQQEDGSILYTAQIMVSGPVDMLTLIPVKNDERVELEPDANGNVSTCSMQQAIMLKGAPLTQEQENLMVFIDLE